jgi:hypothetical protein
MSGPNNTLLSLGYEEVAALSGEAPMAARAGGARGGSGSRISPRLAQSLTATGLPRLTVKELEENAAALRELAAMLFVIVTARLCRGTTVCGLDRSALVSEQ